VFQAVERDVTADNIPLYADTSLDFHAAPGCRNRTSPRAICGGAVHGSAQVGTIEVRFFPV
jgi:hypothetical protein